MNIRQYRPRSAVHCNPPNRTGTLYVASQWLLISKTASLLDLSAASQGQEEGTGREWKTRQIIHENHFFKRVTFARD